VLGIRHSEPYGHDPFPNDQSKAPDAVRAMSHSFCYNAAHWDFDVGADLASNLPSHVDMGTSPSTAATTAPMRAAVTARVRHV
jgi:agmatinase